MAERVVNLFIEFTLPDNMDDVSLMGVAASVAADAMAADVWQDIPVRSMSVSIDE